MEEILEGVGVLRGGWMKKMLRKFYINEKIF